MLMDLTSRVSSFDSPPLTSRKGFGNVTESDEEEDEEEQWGK